MQREKPPPSFVAAIDGRSQAYSMLAKACMFQYT